MKIRDLLCLFNICGWKLWADRFQLITRKNFLKVGGIQQWDALSGRFTSVAQSCQTLYDPMICSTSGLPVHHQLPESTQTHVHRVGDAIQPSHPLSSPSPPVLNLFQHQGPFKWVSSSHQVAKVLEFQLQHQSFQWTIWSPLGWTGWISWQSKGLSRVFSNTTVQKHQFFSAHLSSQSNSHSIHDHWKNHSLD